MNSEKLFQAIGSVGLVLIIVASVFVAVPITIIDPETMVIAAIIVGGPLLFAGIIGAWITAARRWARKS